MYFASEEIVSGKQKKGLNRVFVRKGNLGLGHVGHPFGGEGSSAGWLLLVPAHSAVLVGSQHHGDAGPEKGAGS